MAYTAKGLYVLMFFIMNGLKQYSVFEIIKITQRELIGFGILNTYNTTLERTNLIHYKNFKYLHKNYIITPNEFFSKFLFSHQLGKTDPCCIH